MGGVGLNPSRPGGCPALPDICLEIKWQDCLWPSGWGLGCCPWTHIYSAAQAAPLFFSQLGALLVGPAIFCRRRVPSCWRTQQSRIQRRSSSLAEGSAKLAVAYYFQKGIPRASRDLAESPLLFLLYTQIAGTQGLVRVSGGPYSSIA
jgi:hypothetical protein